LDLLGDLRLPRLHRDRLVAKRTLDQLAGFLAAQRLGDDDVLVPLNFGFQPDAMRQQADPLVLDRVRVGRPRWRTTGARDIDDADEMALSVIGSGKRGRVRGLDDAADDGRCGLGMRHRDAEYRDQHHGDGAAGKDKNFRFMARIPLMNLLLSPSLAATGRWRGSREKNMAIFSFIYR